MATGKSEKFAVLSGNFLTRKEIFTSLNLIQNQKKSPKNREFFLNKYKSEKFAVLSGYFSKIKNHRKFLWFK
ncbi:hypothetical protein EGI11_06710 [Chryseobacterium sp. H3056]|uniref:Uncharacterized protein n=1 Tax=Kaistella daneshvariae TaxID=2487074 RepID=A0A3N0WVJ2_9FLAO|nr:hypothetical protein EGI11_06710 [Kaistella daneshvariae]